MYTYSDGRVINQTGKKSSEPIFLNPIEGDIQLKGIDSEEFYFHNSICIRNNIWFNSQNLVFKRNLDTGVIEKVEILIPGTTDQYLSGPIVSDGIKYIWFISIYNKFFIHRLDIDTMEVRAFSLENYVDGNENTFSTTYNVPIIVNAGTLDENYLWLPCQRVGTAERPLEAKLIRVNVNTGLAKGYDIPQTSTGGPAYSIRHIYRTEKYVILHAPQTFINWFILDVEQEILTRIRPTSATSPVYISGDDMWYPVKSSNEFAKYSLKFMTETKYVIQGENIGNAGTQSSARFVTSAFDGRYLWCIPNQSNRILRFDTVDKTSKGFDYTIGENLPEYPEFNPFTTEVLYDGSKIWLYGSGKIITLSSANQLPTKQVIEKYVDNSNVTLSQDKVTSVQEGSDYSSTAPVITGYQCIGHKINGGVMQSGSQVNLLSIQDDCTITFVYTSDALPLYTITMEYEEDNGTQINPAIISQVSEGDTYSVVIPSINGFSYIGYKINGGPMQFASDILLSNINSNYVVTLVYESASLRGVPAGAIMPFGMIAAPNGWLECDGRAVSRQQYANLFNAIGELYGAGDGLDTFNLPDLRGEFIRGFDNGRGLDPNRQFGSSQKGSLMTADQNQADGCQVQNFSQNNLREVANWDNPPADSSINLAWMNLSPYNDSAVITGPNTVLGVARPYNVAMMYCIKY